MPQFTPADRETVRQALEEMRFIHGINRCGDGLIVICKSTNNKVEVFGTFARSYGWIVETYDKKETGDTITFMPLTEVSIDA